MGAKPDANPPAELAGVKLAVSGSGLGMAGISILHRFALNLFALKRRTSRKRQPAQQMTTLPSQT